MNWESAERVQKNDSGEFRAFIDGEWVPVLKAQKNDAGEFRVMRGAKTSIAAGTPAFEREAKQISGSGATEAIAGNPAFSLLQGAASPFFAAGQLADYARKGLGLPDWLKPELASAYKRVSDLRDEGKKAYGRDGVDWAEMGGSMASPLSIGMMGMKAAPTFMGRIGQGVGSGGLFGLLSPTEEGPGFGERKLAQTGTGMAIGGTIPPLVDLAKLGGRAFYNALIEPWANPAAIKGREWLSAAGDKANQIIGLLSKSEELVPGSRPHAGQAAAPAGSAEFSALVESTKKAKGAATKFAERADEQNLARLGLLSTEAKDAAALRALEDVADKGAKETYGKISGVLVDPRSESQIMRDAVLSKGGDASRAVADVRRLEGAKSAAENAAQNWYPNAGLPRAPGRYSYADELAGIAERKSSEAAGQSLVAGAERRYLENFTSLLQDAGDLNTTSLRDFLSRPSVQRGVKEAMEGAAEKGGYFPKEPGEFFSIGNLQRIKMAIADELQKPEAIKSLGATQRKEIGDTLRSFVDWISSKSPEWKAARLQFSEDMLPANQMRTMQYLRGVLTPTGWQTGAGGQPLNVKGFQEALRKSTDVADTGAATRAAELIQRNIGGARYRELGDYMNPRQMGMLSDVSRDLSRNAAHEGLAQAGSKTGQNAVDVATRSMEEATGGKLGILERGVVIFNQIMKRMEGKVNARLAAEMAADALNPPQIANDMASALARQQRNAVIAEAILKAQRFGTNLGILSANEGERQLGVLSQ